MSKRIIIDAVYPEETRVVTLENNLIQEFDYETASKKQIKGNIYLAKVTRVEPSLQAAFIDYGSNKHGFLPFSEIHPDYYHIPIDDRVDMEQKEEVKEDENSQISKKLKTITLPDFSTTESTEELDVDYSLKNTPEENVQEKISEEEVVSSQELFPETLFDEHISLIEEDFEISSRTRCKSSKNYKIQEVIKKNQIILVQTIKEERGNKGASFTTYISLAGRYCVLMPNSGKQVGISRRIEDIEDRKRLKNIISSLDIPDGVSVIIRTAGAERSKAEILRDYDYLARLWNNIRDYILASKAPCFIHAEDDLIKRTIRDYYDNSIDEIVVQGEESFKKARNFIKTIMPNHLNKVKHYKSKIPIFYKYQVDEQLSELYSNTAALKSGGYLVINHTEALVAVDVNSGRSTSERNIEETAAKTNLEAVYEVARQLRLRDLSGLIVIDFIDMVESKNRRTIEKAMKEAIRNDRAKIQFSPISCFGLMEMSRQRLRPSFIEANNIKCSHCNGKGTVRSSESNAVLILRTIENEIFKGDYELANLYTNSEVSLYLLNHKRADIALIESKYNTKILFNNDPKASSDSFSIERIKRINVTSQILPVNIEPAYDNGLINETDNEEKFDNEENKNTKQSLKKNWRNRSKKNKQIDNKEDYNVEQNFSVAQDTKEEQDIGEEVKKNFRENILKNNNSRRFKRKKTRDKIKILQGDDNIKTVEQKSPEISLLKGLWRKIME